MEAVRNAMAVMVGTPDDIKREIASRIEDLGMTYFFLNFLMPDSLELFAKKVMPEFAH